MIDNLVARIPQVVLQIPAQIQTRVVGSNVDAHPLSLNRGYVRTAPSHDRGLFTRATIPLTRTHSPRKEAIRATARIAASAGSMAQAAGVSSQGQARQGWKR